MFTGIVQEVGKVRSITHKGDHWVVAVSSSVIVNKAAVSESICCNGVCLTLVRKASGMMYFDIMKQTLDTTAWNRAKPGDPVNMEPALSMSGKLDGHFVLGHVDAPAEIVSLKKDSSGIAIEVAIDKKFVSYAVEKGSITLDGISLTIADVTNHSLTVKIIPYTWEHTSLKSKKAGSIINVEFDYLAKIVLNHNAIIGK